jgi:hypothetical protein
MSTATTKHSTTKQVSPSHLAVNGVKAIADVGILPGTSQFIEGDVRSGALYALAGVVAGAVLGPVGWFLVGASSASKSVSGKGLFQHFFTLEKAND